MLWKPTEGNREQVQLTGQGQFAGIHVHRNPKRDVWAPAGRHFSAKLLEQRLQVHGYSQSQIIPGLWTHAVKPTTFTLIVDDFGVKFTSIEDANIC